MSKSSTIYELTILPVAKVIPSLLAKVWQQQVNAIVLTASEEQSEELNKAIWLAGKDSFIPHGTANDGFAERQPIFITHTSINPNSATTLFICDSQQQNWDDNFVSGFDKVGVLLESIAGVGASDTQGVRAYLGKLGFEVSHYLHDETMSWKKVA